MSCTPCSTGATSRYFGEDIRQGDVFFICVKYGDDTDPTGFTHTFTMRLSWDDPVALEVEETVGSTPIYGTDIHDVYIRLPPEKTALLEPGKYVWDLQLRVPSTTPMSDDIFTLAPTPVEYRDQIRVVPQVTEN
jgi:hypothetical protein